MIMKNSILKMWLLLIAVLFANLGAWAQTATAPEGSGTSGAPYQIATLDNLYWLSQTTTAWVAGTYFIQTADIDASATSTWDSGAGFLPIGTATTFFNGSYDGQGHTISGLYINRPSSGIGFFGVSGTPSTIQNLGLIGVNITSTGFTGSLVGVNKGTITNCYSTGTVVSNGNNETGKAGGLIGLNGDSGVVTNCYSACSVSGSYAGGLVGELDGATIQTSYSTGSVAGSNYTGGLVGFIQGSSTQPIITNCYSTASVNGTGLSVGGLIGTQSGNTKTENCYSTGSVTGTATNKGGFVGRIAGAFPASVANINASYWDTQTSGLSDGCGYIGLSRVTFVTLTGNTTANMKLQSSYSGWDFTGETTNGTNDYWSIDATKNDCYPYLAWQTFPVFSGGTGTEAAPYQIETLADLQFLSENSTYWASGLYFEQTTELTFSAADFETGGDFYNGGAGFIPIGNATTKFQGNYDGSGHTISGLYINRPTENNIGLFGYVGDYSADATISNINLTDVDITGNNNVGSVAGQILNSTLTGCTATGSVVGLGNYIGGLSGSIYDSNVSQCGTTCSVTGNQFVGGFVGMTYTNGDVYTISECYASGNVSGSSYVGGFIGFQYIIDVENCYSTGNVTRTSGTELSIGAFCGEIDGKGLSGLHPVLKNSYATGTVYSSPGTEWGNGDGLTANKGFVGSIGSNTDAQFENNFFDIQTTQQTSATGATGKSTAEMKNNTIFNNAGWDFTTIWNIQNGSYISYPYLQAITYDDPETTPDVYPIPGLEEDNCVNPTDGGAIEASPPAVCSGDVPGVVSNTYTPSGHTGDLEYKWQMSTSTPVVSWNDIGSSNSEDYQPGALTQTTWYRRLARTCTDNWDDAAASNPVEIFVHTAPTANTGAYDPICEDEIFTTVLATATNESTVTWTTTGDGNLNNKNSLKGCTYEPGTDDKAIGSFSLTLTVVPDNVYCGAVSSTVTVNIYPQFTPGAIETSGETICYGAVPAELGSVTAAGGGDGIITYSWKSSTDGFATSSPVAGAVSPTYTPVGTLTQTTSYRRYAKDGTCNTTPEEAVGTWTVTVHDEFTPGEIASTGETICYNTVPTELIGSLTAASGGHGNISYSWRSSADSYANDISGATGATYTPTQTLTTTTGYRRYAKDETCLNDPAVSVGTWTVTIRPQFTPGEIATTGETICYGGDPAEIGSVTLASGGDGTLTYSWRSSADSYAADISGAAAATYTPGTLTQTTTFRRYSNDGTCNPTQEQSTGEWTVSVYDEFTSGAIETTGENICYNGDPVQIGSVSPAIGGDESFTYQWQSSIVEDFTNPVGVGANSATYDPPAGITTTTWYRRLAKDGTCESFTPSDGVWKVTVENTAIAGALTKTPDEDIVCEGDDVSATLIAGSGGNGTDELEYRTHDGNDWADWADYISETDIITTGKTLVEVRTRRMADYCDHSGIVAVSWETELCCANPDDGGEISENQEICSGDSPEMLQNEELPTGHTGDLEYKWQSSTESETDGFADIANSDAADYLPGTVTETTWFKRLARVDCEADWSGAVESNVVKITFYNTFTPGAIETTGETICYNTAASVIGSTTAASGGDGVITYSWRSSADDFTAAIDGATAETYTPGTLTQTTSYRRYAEDGTCITTPEQSVGTWTVTVEDELTIECPDDIEVANDHGQCSASVTFAATAGGTPNPTQTYKLGETSITSPYVFDVGTHTAVATATNDCGVVSCSFTVTVNDTEKPNVICQNITIDLDDTGNAVITPDDVDDGSYDNCGIATMTLSRTEFGCADMGETYTVTLTVTDVNENVNTDQATVTVKELSVPSVRVNIRAANASNGQVKFTANPVNGGDNPTYKWYKNGEIIEGETGSELIATCKSGDIHWVVMTSSIPCAGKAESNAMCTY
jgi:hypothetical protein